MEYLDVYDENGNYLKKVERSIVHRDALWHKTVHCWLYDSKGNLYFQIRHDEKTLYTTASGHILAGESVKEGFGREIKEEIGIEVDYKNANLVGVYPFIMDKVKKDGSIFRDRAFSNVYVCVYRGNDTDFIFDESELDGLVKVNAKDTLHLLKQESGKIEGVQIIKEGEINTCTKKEICFEDFLVNKGETAIEKYGDVLRKVIELTK